MSSILVVIVLLFLSIAFLIHYGRGETVVALESIGFLLRSISSPVFGESSQVQVRLSSSESVSYFRRYYLSSDDHGIELRIPKTTWSELYWDKLLNHCASCSGSYRLERERNDGDSECLVMVFGADRQQAADNVTTLLSQVFDVSASDKLTYKVVDIPHSEKAPSRLSILS
jgi:hypothetical protein